MTSLQKISADETLQAAIGHVCATGELQRCAVRVWDKHGECVPVEVYCMPFQHGGQPGCMCFFHLPGVEQPAEEERSLNSFKSRLYAMLVHDFKTPLSVIKMTVGNLESHFDKIDARRRENMFRLIKQSADELTEFVSDLEMINTARSTGLSVHYQQVDVHELCTTTFEEIQAYCNGSHNLTLALPEQPVGLRVDKHLLARALRNLLTNALKFSPKGSHIRLEMLRAEGDILLRVHDQGMGIPEHDKERVFETFYRAKNVGSIGGSGLGLALVKYAVLQQGGSIDIDSAEGVGTTITLRFPASPG
jgi:signal transduction histidine kinase